MMMIWKSSRWGLGVVALRCIYLGPVSLAYLWSERGTAKKIVHPAARYFLLFVLAWLCHACI